MAESILTVEHLYKSFGTKVIFEDLSFGINKYQKVALIGRNGEGKSTLLNMLFDEREKDNGLITFNSEAYPVYLPQSTWIKQDHSIIEELKKNYDEHDEQEVFFAKAKEILDVFGIKDLEKPLNLLSGGEQKKVALANVLLHNSNFYVLDEPTNHLDMDMIKWLENYFVQKKTTFLVVTHDRDFIDTVCTDIYELSQAEMFKYHGNFDYFIEKKAEKQKLQQSSQEKARNLYYKELDWVKRMPQARGTKSKKRIENFETIKEKAFQPVEKQQEEFSVIEKRMGKKILEINSINKSFGARELIKNFSYNFKKGDKISIIGKNGCGKTTLLNIIMGKEKADSGTITKGQTIEFGYYQQQGLEETEDKRVIDVIKDVAENIQISNDNKNDYISASEFLLRFGFPKVMQFSPYSLLSGGEKRRLYLLKTLIQNPNFLILDEPTNDLDIYSLLTLEDFLKNYKGCLLIVSHDKRFIENISENHSFIFTKEGEIKDCYVPYEEYLSLQRKQEKSLKTSTENSGATLYKEQKAQNRNKNKLSFNERKTKQSLEIEIPLLEQKKQELTEKLSSDGLSTEELLNTSQEIERIIAELNDKEMLWLELSEKDE
ncbi:MAG: ABC-F family ATP-binding cassette domain-containing protein [Bacteroidales bacterium]|nr:ABC-F family ATP-binding cassette domain-containing protein [Bacteroidales bacterium]